MKTPSEFLKSGYIQEKESILTINVFKKKFKNFIRCIYYDRVKKEVILILNRYFSGKLTFKRKEPKC